MSNQVDLIRYRPNDGFEYRWDGRDSIYRFRIIREESGRVVCEDASDVQVLGVLGMNRSAEGMARVVDAFLAGAREARQELGAQS